MSWYNRYSLVPKVYLGHLGWQGFCSFSCWLHIFPVIFTELLVFLSFFSFLVFFAPF